MSEFLHYPVVRGAVSGVIAAAVVDIHSFMSWTNYHEALEYNWSTAIFRWAQGAIAGAITAAGYGALL